MIVQALSHFRPVTGRVVTPNRRPRGQTRSAASVAPETGPFADLAAARHTLVVADIENWVLSARDLGLAIDFPALADLLRARLGRVASHGVLSVEPHEAAAARTRGADAGWILHPRSIVATATRRHANADTAFACTTTALVVRERPDAVILGTGDGPLGLDVARFLRREYSGCRRIATLSLAGATSRLLDARDADAIDLNLEIGMDVLDPKHAAIA